MSRATVSNYLNGKSARLSEGTRLRIAEVVEALGYRPMLGARRLSSRTRSNTVGLVVRRDLAGAFADPYMARVMAGVGASLGDQGLRGLVVTSPPGPEDTDYLLSLARGIVDGFLVFDIDDHDRSLEAFTRHQVPFVAVGRPGEAVTYPWVAADHAAAVYQAVTWLAAAGHRRIALVQGTQPALVHRHRREGYLAALAAAGLEADPALPTAALTTQDGQIDGVTLVVVDHFEGLLAAGAGWIDAPATEVGRRAAALLTESIEGRNPGFELLAAAFHPPTHEPKQKRSLV